MILYQCFLHIPDNITASVWRESKALKTPTDTMSMIYAKNSLSDI